MGARTVATGVRRTATAAGGLLAPGAMAAAAAVGSEVAAAVSTVALTAGAEGVQGAEEE